MGVRRRAATALAPVAAAAVLTGCTASTPAPSAVSTAATVTAPTPTPSPTASPTEPALELGGVFVPVPARMLDPSHVRCGVAVRDAAHVVDPADLVAACAVKGDPTHVTEVVLRPLRFPHPAWADGRAVEIRAFPRRGVQLVVRSPSAARAKSLADGAFVVDDPDGCPIQAADLGKPPKPKRIGSLATSRAGATVVCGYRRGRLTQSQTLTEAQGHALTAALWDAPTEGLVRPCPYVPDPPPEIGFWVVMLEGGGRIWQQHITCVDVLVADDGTFAGMTSAVALQLGRYAQGPPTRVATVTSTPTP